MLATDARSRGLDVSSERCCRPIWLAVAGDGAIGSQVRLPIGYSSRPANPPHAAHPAEAAARSTRRTRPEPRPWHTGVPAARRLRLRRRPCALVMSTGRGDRFGGRASRGRADSRLPALQPAQSARASHGCHSRCISDTFCTGAVRPANWRSCSSSTIWHMEQRQELAHRLPSARFAYAGNRETSS